MRSLILLLFRKRRRVWLDFCSRVARKLKRIEREEFKELGISPCISVGDHTMQVISLTRELTGIKEWPAEKRELAELIAYIHDMPLAISHCDPFIPRRELPVRVSERVRQMKASLYPKDMYEVRIMLVSLHLRARRYLGILLSLGGVDFFLKRCILWCLDRYYWGDNEEAYFVMQVHELVTLQAAWEYERKFPWFGESKGAEVFEKWARVVITDPEILKILDENRQN